MCKCSIQLFVKPFIENHFFIILIVLFVRKLGVLNNSLILYWFLLYHLDYQAFSLGTGCKTMKNVIPDSISLCFARGFFIPDSISIRGVVKTRGCVLLSSVGTIGEPRRILTRPGRLRARSGSKLPEANVPLRALEGWVTKDYLLPV